VVVPESYEPAYLRAVSTHLCPDVVLAVGWVEDYTVQNTNAIREVAEHCGALKVYWATEDIQHLHKWSLPFARRLGADLVMTINEDCVREYQLQGHHAGHLDFGCNTDLFRTLTPDPGHACDVLLVARAYNFEVPFREKSLSDLLLPLLDQPGLDLRVWGSGWDMTQRLPKQIPPGCLQGLAPYTLTPLLYSSARIVLGPQNENRYDTQVTMRTFEIMGTGSLLLTSKTPAILRLFKPGEHLLVTASPGETSRLVAQFLRDNRARRQVGEAGRQEVLRQHTYVHRAEALVSAAEAILAQRHTRVPGKPRAHVKIPSCLVLGASFVEGERTGRTLLISPKGEVRLKTLLVSEGWNTRLGFKIERPKGNVLQYILRLWQVRGTEPIPKVVCSCNNSETTAQGPDAEGWWSWSIRPFDMAGTLEVELSVAPGEMGSVEFASMEWSGSEEFKPRLVVIYR
jgi:hypothetical protein